MHSQQNPKIYRMKWCEEPDLNRRTTKDQALNLAPLTMLSYPRSRERMLREYAKEI